MNVNFSETSAMRTRNATTNASSKSITSESAKAYGEATAAAMRPGPKGAGRPTIFRFSQELFEQALAEAGNLLTEAEARRQPKPVIGIPLALHSLEWGVFWAHLISELGFPVLMSPKTTNKLAFLGVENVVSEVCFPVKVFHGHVRYLMDRAEYLFLPNVVNTPVPQPDEIGYFCPLVQSSQFMSRSALNIADRRIIRPSLYLKEDPAKSVFAFEKAFPRSLRPKRVEMERALFKAMGEADGISPRA